MRMRWLADLLFAVGPLVAAPCQGFGNAAEIIELG